MKGVVVVIQAQAIGDVIRYYRKAQKISQEKMALDLGMYQADISNLERAKIGSGIGDVFKLDEIADYFKISIVDLIFGRIPSEVHDQEKGEEQKRGQPMDAEALSRLFRYRLMLESFIQYPHVYDDLCEDEEQPAKILETLKASCPDEAAYQLWKKDLVDARMQEHLQKEDVVVCKYIFMGVGQYKELLLKSEIDSFLMWIDGNGSAIYCGSYPANRKEIRAYVSRHLIDDLPSDPEPCPLYQKYEAYKEQGLTEEEIKKCMGDEYDCMMNCEKSGCHAVHQESDENTEQRKI